MAMLRHASAREIIDWLGDRLALVGNDERRERFVGAVRGNLLFPDDADALIGMISPGEIDPSEQAAAALSETGSEFFEQAIASLAAGGTDFAAWTRAITGASGRRGAALYRPLRVALTGRMHGPELAPLVELMGPELVTARLRAAAGRATSS